MRSLRDTSRNDRFCAVSISFLTNLANLNFSRKYFFDRYQFESDL